MSILSFDIGIKNLAFCQLSKNKQIQDWGIINISCDCLCEHKNTKGNSCDKSATYTTNWLDNNIKLCTSHSKLKQYKPPDKKKLKKIKTNNSILNVGKKMIEKLKEYPDFLNCREVIVENQPSLKNPTMKSIQMMVYTYFLINGVSNENSNINNLEMINARNKLKVYKGPPIECKYKETYKRNKYLAVKYCEIMIKEEKENFIQLYNSSKKKDDLSDSYLQGIYWLNK